MSLQHAEVALRITETAGCCVVVTIAAKALHSLSLVEAIVFTLASAHPLAAAEVNTSRTLMIRLPRFAQLDG